MIEAEFSSLDPTKSANIFLRKEVRSIWQCPNNGGPCHLLMNSYIRCFDIKINFFAYRLQLVRDQHRGLLERVFRFPFQRRMFCVNHRRPLNFLRQSVRLDRWNVPSSIAPSMNCPSGNQPDQREVRYIPSEMIGSDHNYNYENENLSKYGGV